MSLRRTLGVRILGIATLCGLLMSVASAYLVVDHGFPVLLDVLAGWIRRGIPEGELRRCEAQPSAWLLAAAGGTRAFAYDVATGRSLDARAPAPNPALLQRIARGAETASQLYVRGGIGGELLLRVAPAGPCSLVRIEWEAKPERRHDLLLGMVVLAAAALALAVGVGTWWMVRPLVRRIESLSQSAAVIGTDAEDLPRGQGGADELGQLEDVLRTAHGRIRSDGRALEERRRALEVHLANIAHDLRVPFTSLQLTLEEGVQRVREGSSDRARALLGHAIEDVAYLAALVEDLRTAAELRAGADVRPEGAAIDLRDVVERVTARLTPLARQRQISLRHAIPEHRVTVRCHWRLAQQVVGNLVQNAVQHGRAKGNVAVILESERDRFRLVVLDDGPGIRARIPPQLGDQTFRVDDIRQRDPEGGGLGLAIVNEICGRAGFTLTLESADPEGFSARIEGAMAP